MRKFNFLLPLIFILGELNRLAKCMILYKTDKSYLRNNVKHQIRSVSTEGSIEVQIITDGTTNFMLTSNIIAELN